MSLPRIAIPFVILAGLLGAQLPSAYAADKIKIAIVTDNPADFWDVVEYGAKAAAKKHEVELIFRKPEKGDASLQEKLIDELLADGIDGLAVSVINPREQTEHLKLVGKKTRLITLDTDAPESTRVHFVGTDNYAAGKAAGRLVKEALPDGGTLAIFVGFITPPSARDRYQGVLDELAGMKDAKGPKLGRYTLYQNEPIADDANPGRAKENAERALLKLGDEKNVCFVGLWSYNPPAAHEAVKAKGLLGKVKIVGFDEHADTLKAIEKGEIHATIVQDPYQYGYKSVEVLSQIAKAKGKPKDKLPEVIDIPIRIVTKDGGKGRLSVKEFQADLLKKSGK